MYTAYLAFETASPKKYFAFILIVAVSPFKYFCLSKLIFTSYFGVTYGFTLNCLVVSFVLVFITNL